MKLRVLGAALAAMLGCVSANTANATALPAQFRAGQQVMNNAGGDHSQAAIMDFCKREGIPLRPVGTQFIGKTDFCVFAYTAYLTGQSYNKNRLFNQRYSFQIKSGMAAIRSVSPARIR